MFWAVAQTSCRGTAVKMVWWMGLFSCILASWITAGQPLCPDSNKTPLYRLRQNIMCNYDKNSRPVKNSSQTVTVKFTLDLRSVLMEEHRQQTMDVDTLFRVTWSDEFLVWKPADYDGISYIRTDNLGIWVPDLTVNLVNQVGWQELPIGQCSVTYRGIVNCLPKVRISAPCRQDVRRWPFDQHDCNFDISSYSYYEHQLSLSDGIINRKNLQVNREWDVTDITQARKTYNLTGSLGPIYYPIMSITLKVNRHAGFYAGATVLPAMMLLTIVLNSFWLGPMLTARLISLGFVAFSCVMYLNYLMYIVPANGNDIPVIVTLFRDCLALSAFGMVIATTVKRLYSCETVPPLWLSSVLDRLEASIIGRILFLMDAPTLREDEAAIIEPTTKGSLWISHAVLLDRISFLCCCLVTFILLLGYLPY